MDIVMSGRQSIIWSRLFPLILIAVMISGCASRGTPAENGFVYKAFRSETAISDKISLREIGVRPGELRLKPNNLLVSSAAIRVSPLELTKVEKIGSLYLLARKVNLIATYRHDGDNKQNAFNIKNGNHPGYRFQRKLEYRNWKEAARDFPSIPLEVLKKNGRKISNGVEIVKWQSDFYFVSSPDKTAYKIVLANTRMLDHHAPDPDNGPIDNPEPYYAAYTIRYPRRDTERVYTTSIIFRLVNKNDQRVYTGEQQSSSWLPLPGNNDPGPYNLYFTVVYASNSQSVFDLIGGLEKLVARFVGG